MSFALFAQVLFNIIVLAGLFVVFARLRRPAKDDPRLSKGLQLLSNKIAVLEDLSDRTESQVQQMLQLLEQKSKELQSKIYSAEQHIGEVRVAIEKSLEVSKIFQDKIPHSEIIERQQSKKYLQAARLAYSGLSVEDIAKQIDLPLGEIEFIAKVNRETLTFRESELPEWAREPEEVSVESAQAPQLAPSSSLAQFQQQHQQHQQNIQHLQSLQQSTQSLDSALANRAEIVAPLRPAATPEARLEMLGQEFRRALPNATSELEEARSASRAAAQVAQAAPVAPHFVSSTPSLSKSPLSTSHPTPNQVRRVEFPRIN